MAGAEVWENYFKMSRDLWMDLLVEIVMQQVEGR
jgi:hypothetical protein